MAHLNFHKVHQRALLRRRQAEDKKRKALQWTRIRFGKYSELTLPQLVLVDINYFYWAIRKHAFRGQLAKEAEILAERVRHIRPTQTHSDRQSCKLETDKRNRLVHVTVVYKPADECDQGQFENYVPHLDLSIVPKRNYPRQANAVMVRFLRRHFFGTTKAPSRTDCHRFFSDVGNFDLDCCERHDDFSVFTEEEQILNWQRFMAAKKRK